MSSMGGMPVRRRTAMDVHRSEYVGTEEFGQDQRKVDLWRHEARRTRSALEQESLSRKVCSREL
jgi:hypothetical protein